jgi:hypothetical protein
LLSDRGFDVASELSRTLSTRVDLIRIAGLLRSTSVCPEDAVVVDETNTRFATHLFQMKVGLVDCKVEISAWGEGRENGRKLHQGLGEHFLQQFVKFQPSCGINHVGKASVDAHMKHHVTDVTIHWDVLQPVLYIRHGDTRDAD